MSLQVRGVIVRKMMGSLMCSAAIAAFCLPSSLQAQAPPTPTKVAIINAQKAVADTQEIQKAQKELEVKYGSRQQAIAKLQSDLQNLQSQLNGPNLPPDREATMRADFTVKQKQLQRLGEDLQSDVNNERQDILGRAGRHMTDVVKKLAEERGFDVVIDITNTLYFKPGLDITAAATAAYDKAFPVSK
jgi:outer membrane protein